MDKAEVLRILRDHAPELRKLGVIHAGLFGSVARGEAGPTSDIDIAIDLAAGRTPGVFEFVGMTRQIAELFEGKVDVVERRALKPGIRAHVDKDIIRAF